jgi:hypothetical protein
MTSRPGSRRTLSPRMTRCGPGAWDTCFARWLDTQCLHAHLQVFKLALDYPGVESHPPVLTVPTKEGAKAAKPGPE